jgi:hypothetical protein
MNAVAESELKAVHESAHAAIRLHFRHPIEAVEIDCVSVPSEWQQRFDRKRIADLAKRESLVEHIIFCCAGKAAMDRWYGYKASTDTNWKQSADYRNALDSALKLAGGGDEVEAGLWLQIAEHKADKLIAEQWGSIHRLAFALLDREKLSGAQIDEILVKPNK